MEKVKGGVLNIFLIVLFVSALLTGGYFFLREFLKDRQSMMNFRDVPARPIADRPFSKDGKQVKTYTAKELEEARRKGEKIPGVAQSFPPNQANLANEAAVQQSLRTLEEINKINQMNQRLMDQQRRMQSQQR